jgi:integrase
VAVDVIGKGVTGKSDIREYSWKGRFGFHNFRHSLATSLVKLKVDSKTVQGVLRHEDFGSTMDLGCARQVPRTADRGQNSLA